MPHRADLNAMSSADRQTLVNLMLLYLTDAVVADHTGIIHTGLELFTGHRAYIAGMETYLTANGGASFVPLPMWDPATPIPTEFNVVKPEDNGTPRPPLTNLNPNMPLPGEWEYPLVCDFESGADLGNAINGWHGSVHGAIGGTMGDFMTASAAPIFWCWHAFVDHIYWNWQRCQVSCPNVVGYPLGWAKHLVQRVGLKVGCVTRLPRYVLPPERVPAPYPPPQPDPYSYLPIPKQPMAPELYPYGDHNGKPPSEQYDPNVGKQKQQEPHDHTSHQTHTGHSERSSPYMSHPHEDPFRHPRADYSHLLRGPIVISQSPTGEMQMSIRTPIDLVVVTD